MLKRQTGWLFCLATMLVAVILMPVRSQAMVNVVNPWPATPPVVSNGAAGTASGKVVVGAGSNRAMLVVVACEYSATPTTQTISVTYGGKSLNQIATNITQKSTIWIGSLDEANIAAASSTTLTVTHSFTGAVTHTALYATSAVYAGVDQSTPAVLTTGSATTATASAASMVLGSYSVSGSAGIPGMSVYVANWNGQTSTPSAGYTEESDYAGTNFNLAACYKQITAGGSETPTSTAALTSGAMVGVGLKPALKYATISTCGDCHSNPPVEGSARNVPIGSYPGSHNKHSGTAEAQYGYACTKCHYNNAVTSHSNGYKNITGSSLPGNAYQYGKSIAITNSPTLGTCTNTACHSTARTNIQFATTIAWGTNGTTNCLSCHAGRASALGAQSNSTAGFKLSTTHSSHLKYPAANINCNICHSKTVTDAATLKSYTGVLHHANGVRDVTFTGITYGSYTAYKSTEAGSGGNTKTCNNISCHGGKTKTAWTSQSPANTDNTCLHCHGYGTTTGTALRADKYNSAPGWGGTGISTDGNTVATDPRVGAHYVHLSSVYIKKMKCNECHLVPLNPFDAGHTDTPRFSSGTISFAQASTANKNSVAPAYTAGTSATPATCTTTYCHGSSMPRGDTGGTAPSPQWNQDLTALTPDATTCGRCHGNPPLFGSSSSAHTGSAATTSCNGCHKTVTDGTGKIINKSLHINAAVNVAVDTTITTSCHSCHGNPPQNLTYGRYSGLVKPKTLALGAAPANVGAHIKHQNNGLTCNTCHNNFASGGHPDNKIQIFFRITSATHTGWNATSQKAPYGTYSGNSGGNAPVDTTSSLTLVRGTASTANSCNVYCHGAWNGSGKTANPRWTGTATCGVCHGAAAATPPQVGTHARHAGYSSALTARQGYSFACTKCHPTRTANDHVKGTVHVRYSTAVLGAIASYIKTGATLSTGTGYRLYNSNQLAGTIPDGSCSNISCHSNGRASGMGTLRNMTTATWGTTTRNCLSCHGGRASAQGAPARSIKGFTLSTTHSQHLKYPSANINCQICHSKTATDAASLKNFTGVQRHVNGVRDVTFTGVTYGSYTSYKSTEAGSGGNTKTCNNVSCHGGKSRSAWSATTTNNDNTCVHCHGTVGTSSALANIPANRKYFAPGWNKTGTSTDQTASSNDFRVGSHFKHLSSLYMKSIKCNECHMVPGSAFDGTHMATPRYNSQTLTFAQASTAKILIGVASASTPQQLSAFSGYTVGTAIKAATCSSVYCHGNRMKNGEVGGTYRKPYWNYSAMINYTDKATSCARCHGYPPTSNSHSASTVCSTCHSTVVDASNNIKDKTLHINGKVERTIAHNFPYPGATHASPAGTTPWAACNGCHTTSGNTTYPVTAGTAPDCTGCHKNGLKTPSGTSSCWDCHGATATDGRPNGNVFPNYSGSHTKHVVNQGMACSACHATYGGNIGDTRHGFSNRTAHTFALGFVNVTSTTAQFKYTKTGQGTCSNISCHPTAQWGVTKLQCNSCHSYLATDAWTTTYGTEGIGAHIKHINYISTRWGITLSATNDAFGSGNSAAVCGVCHSITPSDHSMTNTVNTRTINFGGSTARQFGPSVPFYNGASGTSSAANPKSCSNIDCHYLTSPIWMTY